MSTTFEVMHADTGVLGTAVAKRTGTGGDVLVVVWTEGDAWETWDEVDTVTV